MRLILQWIHPWLLNKKSFKIRCFKQDLLYIAIREREKLRDLGMFFKRNFKCFKNEKVNFSQLILKLECLLYQNIYIISSYFKLFIEKFRLNKKKVYQQFKKNAVDYLYINLTCIFICIYIAFEKFQQKCLKTDIYIIIYKSFFI